MIPGDPLGLKSLTRLGKISDMLSRIFPQKFPCVSLRASLGIHFGLMVESKLLRMSLCECLPSTFPASSPTPSLLFSQLNFASNYPPRLNSPCVLCLSDFAYAIPVLATPLFHFLPGKPLLILQGLAQMPPSLLPPFPSH